MHDSALHEDSKEHQMNSEILKIGKLNHVAIATNDLKSSAKFYSDVLGAKVSDVVPLESHKVNVVIVSLNNTKIELISPIGDDSPITAFLQKNKFGGMHHICVEVDDIDAAINSLKAKNIRCLSDKPTIGFHGKPVVFLHPKDCHGVLVEVEQV